MKTPDEIKKGLACPVQKRGFLLDCSNCAYHGRDLTPCRIAVHEDALAYIEKLEERIDLMLIQMRGDCGTCRFRFSTSDICVNCTNSWDGTYHPCWEYEGFPGEDTKHAESV